MAAKKFLSGIDLNNQKGVGAADGSAATDLATYGQLLNLVNGRDYKDGVVAATQANITLSAPGTTMDGVTLGLGDRVLLLGQTTTSQNGIWVYAGAAAAMTRPSDFPTGATNLVSQGATVVVDGGTVEKGEQWTLTTPGAINVDTTALAFTRTTAAGASYTAGNGIALTTGAFSVKLPASSGLIADGTGLYLDTSISLRRYAATVGDGTATSITVTHNLNNRDTVVRLYTNDATGAEVETDVQHPAAAPNTVVLVFAAAPSSAQYRVVVLG